MAITTFRLSKSIASTQEFLDREQFSPRFQVENFTKNPSDSSDFYSDALNVFQVGGVYNNLKVKTATYIQATFERNKNNAKSICIPIKDYFTCGFGRYYDGCNVQATSASRIFTNEGGRIYTWIDLGQARLHITQMGFSLWEKSGNEDTKFKFNDLMTRKFLQLQYQDIFGKIHNKYYEFSRDTGSTGKLLTEQVGKRAFDIYKKEQEFRVVDISLEFLQEKLNKNDYDCGTLQ